MEDHRGPPWSPAAYAFRQRISCSGTFMTLVLEQFLNGVQFGVMLFLLAAGLTLIFGIMGVINLAHGSLYMIGAYAAALVAGAPDHFCSRYRPGLLAAAAAGLLIEYLVIRRLYASATTSIRCSRHSA